MPTFEEKYLALKKRLEEHGYILYGVVHFKKYDRIHFGNENIKISLNLRGTLSEVALDGLIERCVGRDVKR